MAFYDNEGGAFARQSSWDQPPPPSRSGTGSSMSQRQQSEVNAFASQFEEIDRATDNLVRTGKMFPGQMPGAMPGTPGRRESVPMAGRGYEGVSSGDARMGGPSRHQSVSEYDSGRPGSAGLQGYYAGQRFPSARQSDAEQMQQAKRRMAAARERELRNYHQEQQFHRTSAPGVKTDRAMSPAGMSEEDRRDLIARQHRALYGDNASLYNVENTPRPQSQDARSAAAGRGASPLAFDPYAQTQSGAETTVQMPPRDRAESTASPAAGNVPQQQQQQQQQSFSHLSETQSGRTSNSSPLDSPPLLQNPKSSSQTSSVAPIGTRPLSQQDQQIQAQRYPAASNKRSTTPLTPSSLSYGFTNEIAKDASSGAPNPPSMSDNKTGVSGLGGWGGNWGSGKGASLAVQPSVWG
ncbi:hypothetical protein LTR62_002850 [Meristemomyces frigidus]|uniref:Uncharacterized protein n=1 Tax=Meristemomyces frigidus TaxID=1508187 RepID=A0AAN7TI87_9PEZI|nr:hypothetical protein LTR62_002850 [Meristemomyces frigidus]